MIEKIVAKLLSAKPNREANGLKKAGIITMVSRNDNNKTANKSSPHEFQSRLFH